MKKFVVVAIILLLSARILMYHMAGVQFQECVQNGGNIVATDSSMLCSYFGKTVKR